MSEIDQPIPQKQTRMIWTSAKGRSTARDPERLCAPLFAAVDDFTPWSDTLFLGAHFLPAFKNE